MTATLIGSVVSGLGGQLALIVSGVLAARMLGPENRGYLALLILIPTAISQLGSLGLPLAVTYELSRDQLTGRGALWNIGRPAILLVSTQVLLHGAILAALFSGRDPEVRIAALFSLLIIPADSAQLFGLAILQGRRNFAAFNLFRLLPAVAYSALALTTFLLRAGSLPQFALWFAGSYLVVAAATMTTALRRSPPQELVGAPRPSKMLRFGLRGLFGSVSPLETLRLDQAIVGLFLSPAALGLYVVGVSFTNLPRFVAQSIGVVAYPYITAQRDPARARRFMWRFVGLSILVCSAVILPLEYLAGWVVPAFFGDAFASAVGIMQILLVSSLFLSARRVLTDASRGIGQPGLGTIAEVASWLSLLPAIGLLAPRFGGAGVAVAFTISAGISLAVLTVLVALRRQTPGAPPATRVAEPRIESVQ
jgi:O-antigen/teichoic acid export membrane protein